MIGFHPKIFNLKVRKKIKNNNKKYYFLLLLQMMQLEENLF